MNAEELGYEVLNLIARSAGGLGHWANVLSTRDEATDKATDGRDRGLFPLPMPATCQRLVRSCLRIERKERTRVPNKQRTRPSSTGHLPWVGVWIVAVNWLAFGCLATAPVRKPRSVPSQAQCRAVTHLTALAQRFVQPDAPGAEVPRTPSEPFAQQLGSRRADYFGNAVQKAYPLTGAQVKPGLPPPGLGGRFSSI